MHPKVAEQNRSWKLVTDACGEKQNLMPLCIEHLRKFNEVNREIKRHAESPNLMHLTDKNFNKV